MADEIKLWEGPPIEAWEHAWRPEEVARRLSGCGAAWCVVGGWAVDLFLGHQTRKHGDLEIAVPRTQFGLVRARLVGFDLYTPCDGEVRAMAWGTEPTAERHQTWVADPNAGQWRVDVMSEPGDAATWVFRRDPSLAAPRAAMVATTEAGIPYLLPHGALLFKAKAMRAKDEADFAACLPFMRPADANWLARALARLHPECPWRVRLERRHAPGGR